MTPKENISTRESAAYPAISSGAWYYGVPLIDIVINSFSDISKSLANPKSPILNVLLWMRILSGLISRCIIFAL